jgi:hypothetical protein
MGGAKGLLNFFVKIEDDGKESSKTSQTKASPTPVQGQPQPATPAPSTAPFSMAHEDAEINKQLSAALEQANQPGYDYFELAKAVETQASIIPSEALRFQSTFNAVASMGVTADKLVSSAQFYLSVLKKKEEEFNKTVESHVAETVTSREAEIRKFDTDMLAKSEAIKKLTEEINTMQQQKTSLMNDVSSSRAQIEQVRNNFSATMKVFVDRINVDIEKIKTYLGKIA